MDNSRYPRSPQKRTTAEQVRNTGLRTGCTTVIIENAVSIDNKAVAMAYVPWQRWNEVYSIDKALDCGTLFPELNKPFMGRRISC